MLIDLNDSTYLIFKNSDGKLYCTEVKITEITHTWDTYDPTRISINAYMSDVKPLSEFQPYDLTENELFNLLEEYNEQNSHSA